MFYEILGRNRIKELCILGFILLLMSMLLLTCELDTLAQDRKTEFPFKKELHTKLDEIVKQHELMGMSVLLLHDGEIVTQQNFGLRDDRQKLPVNDSTYFRVASISKSFTATAIMQLVEQGKLDLDVPVNAYLDWDLVHPKHPDQEITLRHLMSHTSGIRDGKGYSKFVKAMRQEELDIKELFGEEAAFQTPDMFADHAPGDYFSYTNCTWGIIAALVEIASNERFDVYCKQNIFEPLGIGTSFNVLDLKHIKNLSILYRFEDGVWKAQTDDYSMEAPISSAYENYKPGMNGLLFGPQGSVRSSARDLAIFSLMLLNKGKLNGKQILAPSSVRQMLDNQWTFRGDNGDTWDQFFMSYGLGIHRITNRDSADIIFPDRKMLGHPGIAWGLLSDMYFDPQSKSGIIFITNGSKQAYKYGKNTTFYQVEEDVFEAVFPFLQQLESTPSTIN